jgi:nucleoside-diphosphate-sugar epimerase
MPRLEPTMRVFVLGAGKVGSALARALKSRHVRVALRPARKGLPRAIEADIVIVAVRDRDLHALAEKMAGIVARDAVVVHVSGALDAEALAPLRGACAGVAQMHPMI